MRGKKEHLVLSSKGRKGGGKKEEKIYPPSRKTQTVSGLRRHDEWARWESTMFPQDGRGRGEKGRGKSELRLWTRVSWGEKKRGK